MKASPLGLAVSVLQAGQGVSYRPAGRVRQALKALSASPKGLGFKGERNVDCTSRASVPHPKRLRGSDYRGQQQVFITTITPSRRATFCEDAVCEYVASQLLQRASEFEVEVTAYCLMPDHVHALLRGLSEASDIVRSIARWKQFTGYWFGQRNRDRLWEPGFWDRVIRGDDNPAYFVHYIVMNPVRRGLVTAAQEYRWLGSSVFTRDELVRIATDFESGTDVSLT